MDPWYKYVTPRREVREGRSFSPDEFAIALEQVVSGYAPDDYRKPEQFFSRTCFTRALTEHAGMVLRRLSGETTNTAPVLTLVTQFGGGKTHTLAALYHLANAGTRAIDLPGVPDLLTSANLAGAPAARVGVFVGNAWDPQPGRETPWIDLARQIAGEKGVEALGTAAATTPPGTEAIGKVFVAANAPVLLLLDEVLNFLNRHRGMAESFHAFIQNLTVATTGATRAAAVISLPRSKVEMTDSDELWQERITRVVRRVARDLFANDEAEISEVIRRRLFEDIGDERIRKRFARDYADWCFERRHQLPSEWTAVDSAATEAKAREFLRGRFDACYPFHPATLSVFQRKWRALSQYQQTRGTLAMLAQWISLAAREHFEKARREPLITLGSAPLDNADFRAVVLGQLGESRLDTAILADIAGEPCHARALDADTPRGPLRDIHRRVGAAILFESSGGQIDKVAHLPELRFALGEPPEVDTATIDTAAAKLEAASFFIRKVGTDGYRIHHQATLKKVVSDRRASLDEATEVKPAVRRLVESEFERGASVPIVSFPADSTAIQDAPRLRLVVGDPETEWNGDGAVADRVADWTRDRGPSPRLYPAALIWCLRKPGRELRDAVEHLLAWRRVATEVHEGLLGTEYDRAERAEVQAEIKTAEGAAKDQVWSSYRFVVASDAKSTSGRRVIDLGAGHASASETLCGRIVGALKSEGLVNEGIGAGYLDRNWPPAFKDNGAWPLASLRQSFLNGTLTRLLDPDPVLRARIAEFVVNGEFGLGSGAEPDGKYRRVWFREDVAAAEVAFEPDVYLLTKSLAEKLKSPEIKPAPPPEPEPPPPEPPPGPDTPRPDGGGADARVIIGVAGSIPSEQWNRLGTRLLPKLRAAGTVAATIRLEVEVDRTKATALSTELRQVVEEAGLSNSVQIDQRSADI
jgi:hypothetical protein